MRGTYSEMMGWGDTTKSEMMGVRGVRCGSKQVMGGVVAVNR